MAKINGGRILRIVTPKPKYGVAGVVVPLAIGAAGILGTYIVLTRVLNFSWITEFFKKVSPLYPAQQRVSDSLGLPDPDPFLGQWGNMWNDAANLFAPNLYIALSATSAKQGDTTARPESLAQAASPARLVSAHQPPDDPQGARGDET